MPGLTCFLLHLHGNTAPTLCTEILLKTWNNPWPENPQSLRTSSLPCASLSSCTAKAGGLPGNSQGNQQVRETKVALALLGTASPFTGAVSALPRLGFSLDKVVSLGTLTHVPTWILFMLLPFGMSPVLLAFQGRVCLVQETPKSQGRPVEKGVFGSLFPAG